MKHIVNRRVVTNNRLVLRLYDRDSKKIISQGKRVQKNCPLTDTERRIYVTKSRLECVYYMMKQSRPQLNPKEIIEIINSAE